MRTGITGTQREVPGSCTHSTVLERDAGIGATSRLPEQLRSSERDGDSDTGINPSSRFLGQLQSCEQGQGASV